MRYQNPILYGDYSDPDVIRVGEDYYMVSSSFTYLPGIPVLHSGDLVHWRLINYVVKSLPSARYGAPAHQCGTWAPSIRHHSGTYYVYVCLPDEGLFAFTAKHPADVWEAHYVMDVTGWIDPCPFWDGDGSAYLLHAFSLSRVGV
ncbi:MAG: family 43 glycosylhydrolase, partial [Bacillota bacterium]